MLEIEDLHFRYRKRDEPVLRGISLGLEAGEIGKPVAEKPREDQISLGDLGGELVLKKLRMTDVNTLTPLMALNLVEEWKKDLG